MTPNVINLRRALRHMNLVPRELESMDLFLVRHWMCNLAPHAHDEVMRLAEEFGEGEKDEPKPSKLVAEMTERLTKAGAIHGATVDEFALPPRTVVADAHIITELVEAARATARMGAFKTVDELEVVLTDHLIRLEKAVEAYDKGAAS